MKENENVSKWQLKHMSSEKFINLFYFTLCSSFWITFSCNYFKCYLLLIRKWKKRMSIGSYIINVCSYQTKTIYIFSTNIIPSFLDHFTIEWYLSSKSFSILLFRQWFLSHYWYHQQSWLINLTGPGPIGVT